MRRTSLYTLFALLLLTLSGIYYLLLPSIPSELFRPQYRLLPLPRIPSVNDPPFASPPISAKRDAFPNLILTPSLFATSSHLTQFLADDAYYARLLMQHIPKDAPNNTDTFKCVCGRVSDVCSCCGTLDTCSGLPDTTRFPKHLCKPLVLHSVGDKFAASFCLNLTYIPSKLKVKTAGFLSPPSPSPNEDADFRFNKSRILFADIYVPLQSPPVYCVENSRTFPDLSICHQLTSLRYSYESDTNHKTVFSGCGQVSLWVRRHFVISVYKKFCFKAHRGASGDLDQGPLYSNDEVKHANFKQKLNSSAEDLVKIRAEKNARFDLMDGHVGNP